MNKPPSSSNTRAHRLHAAQATVSQEPDNVSARITAVRLLFDEDREGALALLNATPEKIRKSFWYQASVARFWIDVGEIAEALPALDAARAIKPDHPEVRRLEATIAEKEGRFAGAAVMFASILSSHPNPAGIRLSLARCLWLAGDIDTAIITLLEDPETLSKNQPFVVTMLEGAAKSAQPEKLIGLLGKLRAAGPLPRVEIRTRIALAQRLRQCKGDDAALSVLAAQTELAQQDAPYADMLVGLMLATGRHVDAQAQLEALSQHHEDQAFLHMRRGMLAEAREDKRKALDAYSKGASAHPSDKRLAFAQMRLLLELEPSDELVERAAASTDPQEALLAVKQLVKEGRFDEAEKRLEAIEVRFTAQHPKTRAAIHFAQRDWTRARQVYDDILSTNPAQPFYISARAQCDLMLGDTQAYRDALQHLEEMAPTQDVLSARHELQAKVGMAQEALDTADAILAIAPSMPANVMRKGRALIRVGRPSEASSILSALAARLPARSSYRRSISSILWSIGEYDEAIDTLRPQDSADVRGDGENLDLVEYLVVVGRFPLAHNTVTSWKPHRVDGKAKKYQALALLQAEEFDFNAALASCEEGLRMAPDERNLKRMRTRCLISLCRPHDALNSLADTNASADEAVHNTDNDLQTFSSLPADALFSFFGHLVNEMRLAGNVDDRLAQAIIGPPADGVRTVSAIVRDNALFTPPGMALLTLMRRAGLFDNNLNDEAVRAGSIPKTIHQYWEGRDVPTDVAAFTQRLSDRHPDHEHRLWRFSDARQWLRNNYEPAVARAFGSARHASVRADLFRLAVLLRVGGLYVDIDDWCRAALHPLLPVDARLVLHQEELGSVGNNFIAVEPGHPFIEACLEEAVEGVLHGSGEMTWFLTGPGLFTRVLAAQIAAMPSPSVPSGTLIWPRHVLSQKLAKQRPMAYKSAGHHWHAREFVTEKTSGAQPARKTPNRAAPKIENG